MWKKMRSTIENIQKKKKTVIEIEMWEKKNKKEQKGKRGTKDIKEELSPKKEIETGNKKYKREYVNIWNVKNERSAKKKEEKKERKGKRDDLRNRDKRKEETGKERKRKKGRIKSNKYFILLWTNTNIKKMESKCKKPVGRKKSSGKTSFVTQS